MKLDFVKLGLYKIIKQTGLVNYRLKLLARSCVYLIFYISLLKKAFLEVKANTTQDVQPEHNFTKYKVKKILNKQIKIEQLEYLVK